MSGCNLRNDSSEDDRPQFAVIRLKPESNLLGLFQLLLCNGFGEVAFVKNLRDANFGGNKDGAHWQSCPADDQENGGMQENTSIGDVAVTKRVDNTRRPASSEGAEKRTEIKQRSTGVDKTLLEQHGAGKATSHGTPKTADRNSTKIEKFPSLNRSVTNGEMSISTVLPLSNFTCPLPLPVESGNTIPSKKMDSLRSSAGKPIQSKPSTATTTKSTKGAWAIQAKNSAQFTSTQPISQRSSAKETPQQQVFVSCHLCNSKIMATRFSNLTNHVRRHAPVKQFQCCYCDYAHNEIAKVRLHMANNHGDKKSRPINNINSEMQDTWRRLMRECFPERCKRQRQPQLPKPTGAGPSGPTPAPVTATAIISHGNHIKSNSVKTQEKEERMELKSVKTEANLAADGNYYQPFLDAIDPVTMENGEDPDEGQRFARCDQCCTYVNVNMKESHVRTCHLNNLPSSSFVCSLCGLESIERKEVEIHIRMEHSGNPEAQVINADLAAYVDQMIDEYFPLHGLEFTSNFNSNIFDQLKPSYNTVEDGVGLEDVDMMMSGNGINPNEWNIMDHYGKSINRKCRVCHRLVNSSQCKKHARQHVEMSAVYFECPICANYRSNVFNRIQRHLADKHQVFNCDAIPRFLRTEWLPVVGFASAVVQGVKRCFGNGRVHKKRYTWRKNVQCWRIRK